MSTGKRSLHLTKQHITASRHDVRKFGFLFTGVCIVIGGYLFYKESSAWTWLGGGAMFFLATGLFGYPILRPIYIGWMKFAFILGWVNTRLLLGVFFYLVITPIGLFMRLLGKDLLDERINPNSVSHWKKRAVVPYDRERSHRLF